MDGGGQRQDSTVRETPTPEEVVQAQVDAYDRHDIEAFLDTYAPDAKIYGHPRTLQTAGREAMRKDYAALFREHPNVEAIITNRIVQGRYVIDLEELTGAPESLQGAVSAFYGVSEGRIVNVWFME